MSFKMEMKNHMEMYKILNQCKMCLDADRQG